MLLLETVAVCLGLLYLLLAVYQRRSCWLAGGLASLLFLWIFYQAGLPMQALLQVYYVAVAVHGWRHWGAGGTAAELPVSRWPLRAHAAAVLALVLVVAATLTLRPDTGGTVATLDAITSWGSVLATWLVAQKKLEAWWYWVVIDALCVLLYLQSGLLPTAALYLLYTALAVLGWWRWQNDSPQQATD